jgi:hypothetical protein
VVFLRNLTRRRVVPGERLCTAAPPASCKNARFMSSRAMADDRPVGAVGANDRRTGEREGGFSRWTVRVLAALGALLMVLGAFGWWLSTRVLEADGFADVVAKASQKVEVRKYIGDQASLRLARTSNFVSAARPVVADAIAAAVATPPVEDAIREFAQRAHEQVFQARGARRVDVNSQEAAVTIRGALQSINPALAKKLPANVLDATTTISQSDTVDLLFRASHWVEDLYAPTFLAGVALAILAMVKARERVRAIRTVGVTTAVAGGLLLGIGVGTPAFATVAATSDPLRGDAVAAFIGVLVGRLLAAGQAYFVFGLALALAPGHDGGDLRHRVGRVRAWFAEKRGSRRWRFAGGVGLMLLALLTLTLPRGMGRLLLLVGAVLVLYVGIVVCLRASGLMATDHSIPRLHKRQVVGVFAALVAAVLATAVVAVGIVADNTSQPRANPTNQGCNGYIELCAEPLNQVVWPASHNAMSSAAYDFLGAEHTVTIPEQLNAGVRFLMIDAYYGYDDNGLVRTNLAGGIDRSKLRAERGDQAVNELDRLGALTGVADTSGDKQDVYFCHDFCELGAISSQQVFHDIDDFLSRNLTDVLVIDVEDYVQPKDLKAALVESGLWKRVWRPDPKQYGWPTLGDMVTPTKKGADENPRRLVVMSEKHGGVYPWLLGAYDVSQESPFTFTSIPQFNCNPNRGGTDKSFFIVNHWLRPDGPPDPVEAAKVNSKKVLSARLTQCITERQQLPNAVAVDFTSQGDLYKTVNLFNAAIARQSHVTEMVTKTIQQLSARDGITDAELQELDSLHRLPKISEATARALLGPLADRIPTPAALPQFAAPCPEGWHAASDKELKTFKRQQAAASTTSTAPTTAEPAPTTTADTGGPDDTAEITEPAPTTTTRPPVVVSGGCALDR